MYSVLSLAHVQEDLLNRICNLQTLSENPPLLAPEGFFDEDEIQLYPGKIIEYGDNLSPTAAFGGHVVVVEKGENNQLKIYDPQKREPYETDKKVKMYLDSWIDNPEAVKDIKPKIIRIDNKQINPYYESVLVH